MKEALFYILLLIAGIACLYAGMFTLGSILSIFDSPLAALISTALFALITYLLATGMKKSIGFYRKSELGDAVRALWINLLISFFIFIPGCFVMLSFALNNLK